MDSALTKDREALDAAHKTTAPDAVPGWQQQIQTIDAEIKQFRELNILDMIDHRSIQPIQDFVRNAPQISTKTKLSARGRVTGGRFQRNSNRQPIGISALLYVRR